MCYVELGGGQKRTLSAAFSWLTLITRDGKQPYTGYYFSEYPGKQNLLFLEKNKLPFKTGFISNIIPEKIGQNIQDISFSASITNDGKICLGKNRSVPQLLPSVSTIQAHRVTTSAKN